MTSAEEIGGVARRAQGPWIVLVDAAWFAFAALAVVILIASIPLAYIPHLDNTFGVPIDAPPLFVAVMSYATVVVSLLSAAVSFAVAVLLFWKKRGERFALFMSFFLLAYGSAMGGPLEVLIGTGSLLSGTVLPGGLVLSETLVLGIQGAMFIPLAIFFCLFPNGHFVPRWSRYVVFPLLLLTPAFVHVTAFEYPSAMNALAWLVMLLALVLLGVCIYAQFYRYRRVATRLEQQQTKWVVYGLALAFLLALVLQVPYYAAGTTPAGTALPWWDTFSGLGWQVMNTILPLSFAIAVMRYRLWDIDVIVRRTLLYSSLTAILALGYFASVILLQQLFRSLTGVGGELAIIISTLGLAVLSNPLRRRMQNVIDRRFFRQKYNAPVVLARFAKVASVETDLDKLTGNLMDIVNETIQPERVSVWLKGPGRGK
ncbi:MAG TPA: hypothetical protein VIX58_00815 [Anaerolineae bacterium]